MFNRHFFKKSGLDFHKIRTLSVDLNSLSVCRPFFLSFLMFETQPRNEERTRYVGRPIFGANRAFWRNFTGLVSCLTWRRFPQWGHGQTRAPLAGDPRTPACEPQGKEVELVKTRRDYGDTVPIFGYPNGCPSGKRTRKNQSNYSFQPKKIFLKTKAVQERKGFPGKRWVSHPGGGVQTC